MTVKRYFTLEGYAANTPFEVQEHYKRWKNLLRERVGPWTKFSCFAFPVGFWRAQRRDPHSQARVWGVSLLPSWGLLLRSWVVWILLGRGMCRWVLGGLCFLWCWWGGGVPCVHIEVPHTFLLCVVDQVDPCMAEVEHLGLCVLMGWWQCCNSPRRSACSLMSAASFAAVPLSRGGALPFSPHFQSIRI